jgi:D-alanyl-D-alanine carboxypeptidase
MTRTAFLKLTAASAIASIGLGVPSSALFASDGDVPQVNPERAANSAERAEEMLGRGRVDRALRFAEAAVDMDPSAGSHRVVLGQAYMASGRFLSAEASFAAARELGSEDARTIIGHSLSLIATGRSEDALGLLDQYASSLPASDYGLALALAGQAERGALVLTDVVRAGDSTARDRQNLALAYACAGRWLEARLIAAQDLGGARVGERMEQWANMLQSGAPQMRIAGLFGVTPVDDQGMPQRFALNGSRAQVAGLGTPSADPAPLAMYAPAPVDAMEAQAAVETAMGPAPEAEAAPVMVAAVDPAPAAAEVAPAPVEVSSNGVVFVSNPVIQTLRSVVAAASPQPAASRPVRRSRAVAAPAAATPAPAAVVAAAAPTGAVRTTGWAVQLGAYQNVAVSRDAWGRLSRNHATLAARDGVTTSATVNGRVVYRLNATGYANRAEAAAACASVQAAGGTCFVRELGRGDTVRWASRTAPTRVASR